MPCEQRAVVRRQDRAAAGGEHDVAIAREFRKHTAFAQSEARLALDLEYHGHSYSGDAFELEIAIEEALAETAREQLPDRRLAGAHQADQVDVVRASGLCRDRHAIAAHRRDFSSIASPPM